MDNPEIVNSSRIYLLALISGLIIFIFAYIYNCNRKSQSKSSSIVSSAAIGLDTNDDPSGNKRKDKVKKKDVKNSFSHKWLITSLRTHSSNVLAVNFSPNGKYLASCSEDRSIYIWYVKEFVQKELRHVRVNVEFDHATKLKFSPDNKAILTSLAISETLRIFRINRKEDYSIGKITPAFDFPHKHNAEIINIGVACNGNFVMSCYNDTTIKIWTIKGDLLHTIDTLQVNNTHGCVSPCGRFVASSGFTSDVKVWEVCFDKTGNFKEIIKAFQLTGHTSGVYTFAFNSDSTRMASVSKDGTWKLWNTDVDYQRRQDPRLVKSWNLESNVPSLLTMSPDGLVVAIASATSIYIYDVTMHKVGEMMHNVHNDEIKALEFSTNGSFLVSAGDRTINIFHNVVGLQSNMKELITKLTTTTTKAMKERIEDQLVQYRDLLNNILEKD